MNENLIDENLRHEKIQAEIAKIFTEIEKMRAETTKVNSENRWYPFAVGSTITLAIVALVKLFL
jgi:hypothetical protein